MGMSTAWISGTDEDIKALHGPDLRGWDSPETCNVVSTEDSTNYDHYRAPIGWTFQRLVDSGLARATVS